MRPATPEKRGTVGGACCLVQTTVSRSRIEIYWNLYLDYRHSAHLGRASLSYQLRLPQRGIYAARRTSRNLCVKFRPGTPLVRAPGFVEGSAVHPGSRIILQIRWSLVSPIDLSTFGWTDAWPSWKLWSSGVFLLMTNWFPGNVTQLRAHQNGVLQNLQNWHAACLLIVKSGNRTSTVYNQVPHENTAHCQVWYLYFFSNGRLSQPLRVCASRRCNRVGARWRGPMWCLDKHPCGTNSNSNWM